MGGDAATATGSEVGGHAPTACGARQCGQRVGGQAWPLRGRRRVERQQSRAARTGWPARRLRIAGPRRRACHRKYRREYRAAGRRQSGARRGGRRELRGVRCSRAGAGRRELGGSAQALHLGSASLVHACLDAAENTNACGTVRDQPGTSKSIPAAGAAATEGSTPASAAGRRQQGRTLGRAPRGAARCASGGGATRGVPAHRWDCPLAVLASPRPRLKR